MARTPRWLSIVGAVFAGSLGVGIGLAQANPGLSACLADCKRPGLSATNRASCRLDCENEAASDPEQIRAKMAGQTAPAKSAAPAAGSIRTNKTPLGCKASCDADRSLSVDDRASCKLDCEQEALPVPGGPVGPVAATNRAPAPAIAPSPTPITTPITTPISTPTPTPSQAGFLARCKATCNPGFGPREAADFETCKLDCETMASVLDVAREWVPDAWLAPAAPAPVVATPATPPAPIVARVTTPPSVQTRVTTPPAQGCGPALERCNAGCGKQEGACSRRCSGRSATDRETCKLTCGTDREVCQGDCLSANAACLNSGR